MTEPDFCSPHHEDGCLEGLPLSIRRYQYQGRHHLWRMLDLELDRRQRETEYMLFHIDPVDLDHDFLDENTSYFPRIRLCFDVAHKLLLITMPSPEHSVASGALAQQVATELEFMGHGLPAAVREYTTPSIRKKGKGKDADLGWGTRRRTTGASDSQRKYTVTVEVAISETATKLKRDVDFWLNPMMGNANLVITIKQAGKSPESMCRRGRLQTTAPTANKAPGCRRQRMEM